jgi:hypothetical protein
MSYLRVYVNNDNKEFVEQLLQKLGYEVTDEGGQKTERKKPSNVSPTLLFAKWKDLDIDPVNFRKSLWGKRK